MRPGLYEFLRIIYRYYNIAIWSATAWTWLEIKLFEFGLVPNPNFKFVFVLDRLSMFNVKSSFTSGEVTHTVKPLQVIWKNLPQFSERNTLHVDDIAGNFAFNVYSGIRIKPFRYSAEAVKNDKELYYLAKYLSDVHDYSDFTQLDHTKWRSRVL